MSTFMTYQGGDDIFQVLLCGCQQVCFDTSEDNDRSIHFNSRFAAGQNVAAVWTYDRDEGVEPDFLTQVEAWFMEVDQHGFSKGAVDPFKFSKPTGHYTQLVWADTYLVGCGYTYYHDAAGNGYTKLYVCNYGPGGNVVGASMYKVGYPGQPYCVANGLRPSTDYQGLCEEDGVNYKSMCSMGGSSMFHKPKTSSLMMLMHGNSVVDDFSHSHPRSNSPTHPMEVMHPDPPHMEMHDMMQHRSMMRSGQSQALHQQQSHMMLPPPSLPHNFPPNHLGGNNHQNQGGENGLMKTIQSPFAGLVNALSPWNFLNRFKMT
ncbi:CAP domain [Trinorchestia longiramus]|nr:CAP domain [Trinorchestia longiramus]